MTRDTKTELSPALLDVVEWDQLDVKQQADLLSRAPANRSDSTRSAVAEILGDVRVRGDQAVRELTARFDNVDLPCPEVSQALRGESIARLGPDVHQALDMAFENLHKFHKASRPADLLVETSPGVVCQARYTGIETVGLYAPGGGTPLCSSVLMMGVPAMIAGCGHKVLCCGPGAGGTLDPAMAYAAQLCKIDQVFLIGGAQAIGAMAFGTQSVPCCDKLFGPGSIWVTEAKRQVASSDTPVTIDMAAGPSEVMVVADDSADPVFVAADMLAQLEHGTDSQAILVTDSRGLAEEVIQQLELLSARLSRQELVRQSMAYSRAILCRDMQQAISIANQYAAEHLIIQAKDANELMSRISSAGSVFLGPWTPEVLGDYCSGTNHVLPTCGLARSVNGLTTADFMKRITVQSATAAGLRSLAETAVRLANHEGLTAHAMAVEVRQQALSEHAGTPKA